MNYPTLTPVDEALTRLLSQTQTPTATETVPLSQALGRTLARCPVSAISVPNHDNSAMDGYALHTDSLSHSQTITVSQRIPAGSTPAPLQTGTAARIFTGAPIPEGANAVVMQEHTSSDEDTVTFNQPIAVDQNIRRRGEDIQAGHTILSTGLCLRAQDLGLAASVGVGTLEVYKKITVGIFFTGDELVEPDTTLGAGKCYNSNRYTLIGALQSLGCEILDLGNIPDTLAATTAALTTVSKKADLVITTGGVSVGEEDHVRAAVESIGKLNLWRIAMKPGKPLAYGEIHSTPFIGLPGNPVSAFVTFALFARAVILKMQGRTDTLISPLKVTADFAWSKKGFRQEYVRAKIQNNKAKLYPHQGSGVLTSVSWAEGLVIIPIDTLIQKGDMVDYLPFHSLFS